MYRRMCFNVYAHNRDDHAKNFSFLYEEEKKCWRLSPAYDLTYSTTYYGPYCGLFTELYQPKQSFKEVYEVLAAE